MDIIKSIEQESLRSDVPQFNVGDTVRVLFKVIEGNKERIQAYEGVVISRKHGGLRETFTVRRISSGIGSGKGISDTLSQDREGNSGASG